MDFLKSAKKNRLILIVILGCILGRLLISPYPFDEKIMGGGDAPAHVHIINMIKTYGSPVWDRFWFGGEPFGRFYPSLAHLLSSFLPFDGVVSLKLGFLVFFLLAPITFYLLVKEFALPKKEVLVSTIIFSFTMNFSYLFDMGTFPSMVALPFGFLFFKYFVRTMKTSDLKYVTFSSVFLGIVLLMHNIIAAMFILFAFMYLVSSYYFKASKAKIKNSAIIVVLGFLISSVWTLPFIIENANSNFGWPQDDWLTIVPITAIYRLFSFYINGLSTIIAGLATLLIITGFIAFMKKKNADSYFFMSASIVTTAMYLLLGLSNSIMPLSRFVIFMSLPFSVLIAKNINFGRFKWLLALFGVLLVSYFVLTPVQTNDGYLKYNQALDHIQKDAGRLSFEPEINTPIIFTAPDRGIGVDEGAYDFSLPKKHFDFIMDNKSIFECTEKRNVLDRMFSFEDVFNRKSVVFEKPCELVNPSYKEFYRLMDVRYLIVDKTEGVYDVFDKDQAFKKLEDFNGFSLFEFSDARYIETGVGSSYEKISAEKIKISLTSNETMENVRVRVSETWYSYWTVNDSSVKLDSDENGFITLNVPEVNGEKSLLLEFKEPAYYPYFWIFTVIGLIASFAPLFILKRS
jgi:hypothetical protein